MGDAGLEAFFCDKIAFFAKNCRRPSRWHAGGPAKAIGLKLVGDDLKDWKGQPSRHVWLAVAHHHQGLQKVFRDTRWAGGVWVQPMRRVFGAAPAKRPLNFAGVNSRAVLIPFRAIVDGRPVEAEE